MTDSEDEKFWWEPMVGLLFPGKRDNVAYAATLERVRRSVCGYTSAYGADVRCDCKVGLGRTFTEPEFRPSSEMTGCPELREVIVGLLHEPESFVQQPKPGVSERDAEYATDMVARGLSQGLTLRESVKHALDRLLG